MRLVLTLSLCLLAGCSTTRARVGHLATARVTSDFDTYAIHRVGLLPALGRRLDPDARTILRSAFLTELSRETNFEIVPLDQNDLEEVYVREAYKRGNYDPEMVIALARRFDLDGLIVGTVIDYQFFKPQRLSIQVDLVASETGAAIWSASVFLDAATEEVQRAVREYYSASDDMKSQGGEDWEVALLSPRLFAQFAAWQVAHLL